VLTRDTTWAREGAEVAHDVESALAMAGEGEIAVVGGAEIYALFEPLATRVELTEVDLEVEGDAHMPPLSPAWREVARENHPARDGRPAFAFVTLLRDR
jgi:dihydrofolate reductase